MPYNVPANIKMGRPNLLLQEGIRKMGKDLRKMIKEINKGKGLEENLPLYIKMLQKINLTIAALHLSMDYETLFERIVEEDTKIPEEARQVFIRLEDYFARLIKGENIENLRAGLKEERDAVRERADALTACTDRLVNTEYVYNRIELNFTKEEREKVSTDEFTQEVMQYVFADKDNVVTNGRISTVLSQLPVRMSKNRFFDLVKKALALFKEEGAESVNSFIYMLRTVGNLYHCEGMEKYFDKILRGIEELENLDYDKMSDKDYKIAGEKLQGLSEQIKTLTDSYISIQEIINEMLAFSLLYDGEEDLLSEKISYILKMQAEILSYEKYVKAPEHMEEEMAQLLGRFSGLEGIQEEVMEKQNLLESVLDSAAIAGEGILKEEKQENLRKMLNHLLISRRIMGDSRFADIDDLWLNPETSYGTLEEEKISEVDLKEKTAKLINEFEEYFKGHDRKLNRAVMANVLGSLPIFFESVEDFRNYVGASISQCRDESERNISMELIRNIIRAETEFL